MYLLIGADFVPTESNTDLFEEGNITELLGTMLKSVLENASFRIFNLEIPLTDTAAPIPKLGPNLIASPSTVNGYKAAGVDLFTLANNHILDQDLQGLRSTVELLDKHGIAHVGVGENLEKARQPYVFRFAGKQVGVYACAEHEFSIVSDETPGANPFDPLFSLEHIVELKQKCDFVIVLYHGGKEHYRYPSPNLQKTCRRLVDKGADLVICQHSHCIGCEEKHQSGTIVYGQGNFLFDYNTSEFWQTSLLIRLEDDFSISYVPLIKKDNVVRLADDKQSADILCEFNKRSQEIKKHGFINQKYTEFAKEYLDFYLYAFSEKKTLFFRALNKLTKGKYRKKYLERYYDKSKKITIANYVDCEAHRELLSKALANEYRRKKK